VAAAGRRGRGAVFLVERKVSLVARKSSVRGLGARRRTVADRGRIYPQDRTGATLHLSQSPKRTPARRFDYVIR
jgi:hypothetical protein